MLTPSELDEVEIGDTIIDNKGHKIKVKSIHDKGIFFKFEGKKEPYFLLWREIREQGNKIIKSNKKRTGGILNKKVSFKTLFK